MLKKVTKALLIAVIVVAAGFAGLIIYALITDFKPGEKTALELNESTVPLGDSITLNLLTWNIGYCGLNAEMDFFYDGGKKVFTPKETSLKNLTEVMSFLRSNDSLDFVLIQEIDRNGKRSYKVDQYGMLTAHLNYPSNQFAVNYQVFFVPVPLTSPMGKVYSGMSIMGRNTPSSSVRYSFPGKYGFPKQLFMLDRCFIVNRYLMKNGKELVLINTHNEAYDPGQIRRTQMEYLKKFISDEYASGNYVVAGGDWNQCPPGFKAEFADNRNDSLQMTIADDYLPGDWSWAYDNTNPTNRSIEKPYSKESSPTTVIDYFLLSPNVEVETVKCINLEFRNSDHNPVILKVTLK